MHNIIIPSFHPARLNQWDGRHWSRRARLKRGDRELIAYYARVAAIPRAAGKRRVSLRLTLAPGQRGGDPDAYFKSVLDALVHAGLLVDDSKEWCEIAPVIFERGKVRQTMIVLEDLEECARPKAGA